MSSFLSSQNPHSRMKQKPPKEECQFVLVTEPTEWQSHTALTGAVAKSTNALVREQAVWKHNTKFIKFAFVWMEIRIPSFLCFANLNLIFDRLWEDDLAKQRAPPKVVRRWWRTGYLPTLPFERTGFGTTWLWNDLVEKIHRELLWTYLPYLIICFGCKRNTPIETGYSVISYTIIKRV